MRLPEGPSGRTAVLAACLHPARADRADTAPAWGVAELMAAMGQVRASSARFVERKYLRVDDRTA